MSLLITIFKTFVLSAGAAWFYDSNGKIYQYDSFSNEITIAPKIFSRPQADDFIFNESKIIESYQVQKMIGTGKTLQVTFNTRKKLNIKAYLHAKIIKESSQISLYYNNGVHTLFLSPIHFPKEWNVKGAFVDRELTLFLFIEDKILGQRIYFKNTKVSSNFTKVDFFDLKLKKIFSHPLNDGIVALSEDGVLFHVSIDSKGDQNLIPVNDLKKYKIIDCVVGSGGEEASFFELVSQVEFPDGKRGFLNHIASNVTQTREINLMGHAIQGIIPSHQWFDERQFNDITEGNLPLIHEAIRRTESHFEKIMHPNQSMCVTLLGNPLTINFNLN